MINDMSLLVTYFLVWFDLSVDGKQYISKGKVLSSLKTKSIRPPLIKIVFDKWTAIV